MQNDPDFKERITRDLEARKAAARILDVSESAHSNDLKRAYRKAATKYHPDHNGNTPEANKRFALIQCAYELLAFDKPCDKILEEINSWPGVPENSKYRMDNPWGRFLWWRERYFESNEKSEKRKNDNADFCI